MDFRQLRYFLRVTEIGSFSRAAEVLDVAQPSLSQHVRSLEDELGVDLLVRHPQGVTPTDLGRLLCEHARTILRDVERSKAAMLSAVDSPAGEVSLGLPASVCRGLSVPLMAAATARLPNITLHLVEATTDTLDAWTQTGRIDVALLYEQRPCKDVISTDMMTEELKLILPPGHPWARERKVLFMDAVRLALVMPGRAQSIRAIIERNAARAGAPVNVAIECDSLAAIAELVKHGHATLCPSFAMAGEIARREVVAVPVVDPTPTWRLSVIRPTKAANARANGAIARLANDVARSLVERGVWDAQLKRIGETGP